MNDLSFAHPWYLLNLLWLLPLLLVLRLWAGWRGGSAAESMVAPRLRSLLLAGASPVMAWLVFSLQLLSLVFFAATLAQPRWGEDKRQITESGKNIIIAIDTSKSMLADDVKPNRLLRAKLAAQDLVDTLREQRVGLIAFAGRAYLQAPLTTDHAAVVESLQSLDTFTIPLGGTSISTALREALSAFEKTKARSHGLVIISDGGEPDDQLDSLLEKAKQKHVMVITIGVGSELGSLIPDPDPDRQGDFLRDPATGTPVHSKLEEATLQKMAAATNGRYLRLGANGLEKGVLLQTLSSLESIETGSREEVKPIERFYWPLSWGILALMLSLFIRPSARLPRLSPTAVGLIALMLVPAARGSVLSMRQTIDEAQQAYKQHNYSRARDLYARLLAERDSESQGDEFAYGLGASAHQLKDYDRAVDAFSHALRSPNRETQVRSHRSLGNTLYEQGAKALQQQPEFTIKAWTDSLSHYDAALAMQDDKDVRENYEFVRKHLVQLEEQQKQKQEQQRKDQQKGDKKDQKDKQEGEGQKDQKDKGQKGDQEDEGKGSDGQKDDEEEGEGQKGKQGKGEEQQAKEGEATPEGQIKAGESGEGGDKKDAKAQQMQEMAEQQTDERTGFSKNEARSLLRAYSDEMQLQFQQRQREKAVKRDW